MESLKKADLTAWIRHIARFLEIGNSEVRSPKSQIRLEKDKKKKKNTSNCKALFVSLKRKNINIAGNKWTNSKETNTN